MAALKEVFDVKKKISLGTTEFGFVEFDAALNIGHNRSATITDNEVEDESNLTDHYRKNPERISIVGIISEVPLPSSFIDAAKSLPQNFITSRIAGLGGPVLSSAFGLLSQNVLENSTDRRQTYMNKLEEFMDKKVLLTAVTGLKVYNNLMIESIDSPETAQLGESLQVTINLKQVLIVQSQTVLLPEIKTKGSTGHSATSQADLGKQKTASANAEEESRGSSILFKVFN